MNKDTHDGLIYAATRLYHVGATADLLEIT